MMNDHIVYYGVKDGSIYYTDPGNPEDIICFNPSTQKTEKVLDIQSEYQYKSYYTKILCTDHYIVLENELEVYYGLANNQTIAHTLKFYDYNGNNVGTINMDGYNFYSFDERILTKIKPERTYKHFVCDITKGFDNLEWKELKIGE